MSTWTSSPKILAAALLCAAATFPVPASRASVTTPDLPGQALQEKPDASELPVLGASVVIAAPHGYCIDPLATLAGSKAAFVLLADCHRVSDPGARRHIPAPGLLTASVDGTGSPLPSHRELTRYFSSPSGLRALSRSGSHHGMQVGPVYSRHGVLYLHAQEASDDPQLGSHSWRAVFEVNGRMVTATLREFAGQPISDDAGFRTVERFVDRIVAASPASR